MPQKVEQKCIKNLRKNGIKKRIKWNRYRITNDTKIATITQKNDTKGIIVALHRIGKLI